MAHRLVALTGMFLLLALACGRFGPATPGVTATPPGLPVTGATLTRLLPSPTRTPLATRTARAPTITSVNTSTSTITPTAVRILGQHRVAAGETLLCIGRAYGVLPEAIAQVNGFDFSALLFVGQVLEIPAIQWFNILPGQVCVAQFQSPFPALPFVTRTPAPFRPTNTPTPSVSLTDTPAPPTERPIPPTDTPMPPTIPPTETPSDIPSPAPIFTATDTDEPFPSTASPTDEPFPITASPEPSPDPSLGPSN